jgi:hypothetical protein
VTDSHSSEGENPRKVLEMRKRDSYARPRCDVVDVIELRR